MSEMKYYIDGAGAYLGGSDGEPLSANEVPTAPSDARETWDGTGWNKSQEILIDEAKIARDNTLNALVHDFGDGRIMQTRPKDESNIRNAIEIMEASSITSIGWSMIDDVKQNVTAADLKTALATGQLAAMDVWNNYNP